MPTRRQAKASAKTLPRVELSRRVAVALVSGPDAPSVNIAFTVARMASAVNGSRSMGTSAGSFASSSGVDRPVLAR
jgi:hypothetical protein